MFQFVESLQELYLVCTAIQSRRSLIRNFTQQLGGFDDAVFESCENLHWNPREENNYGEGKIQSYQLELPDEKLVQMTAGTYTVLCVGLDNETNDETKEITIT